MVDHRDRFPRRSGGRIILSRLRHRTVADDWSRQVLVGGDSADDLFSWPLDRRRGQHSHRIRSRLNPHRILPMAPRSGGKHDRSRAGGFRCQRPAEIVFLMRPPGKCALHGPHVQTPLPASARLICALAITSFDPQESALRDISPFSVRRWTLSVRRFLRLLIQRTLNSEPRPVQHVRIPRKSLLRATHLRSRGWRVCYSARCC